METGNYSLRVLVSSKYTDATPEPAVLQTASIALLADPDSAPENANV